MELQNITPTLCCNIKRRHACGSGEDGPSIRICDRRRDKRIITQVSYIESTQDENLDSTLILKVATGEQGKLAKIPEEEMQMINTYINQIKFAGTKFRLLVVKEMSLSPK